MSTFALWRLFHRPGRSDTTAHTSALAIIAFAAATAIFLTVLGGLHGFVWRASADHTIGCLFSPDACAPGTYEAFSRRLADDQMTQMASTYVVLAIFACVLLVVPFAALAGSAARLAASRRDARLAALRLAGATTGQVVRLTALDAAGQALVGSLIGIIGYFAIMPLIMLLNFQNQRFTFEQLWVGSIALVAVVAGVTVLALVSALITLRRVAITPLGVMSRAAEPLPAKWRVLIFLVVVAAAYLVFSNPTMLTGLGDAMIYAVVIGFFFLVFAVVNLVGAWVVAARARVKARHPKDAATMIAMRRILDNPKRAWRNVSGVALAVFVAGMEEGIFPHASYDGDEASVEEERRLAYVAITRARRRLYLTHATTRRTYGSMQANAPSRFLREIPERDVERVGVGSSGFAGVGWEKRGDRHGTFGSGRGSEVYGGHVFGSRTRSTGGGAVRPAAPSGPKPDAARAAASSAPVAWRTMRTHRSRSFSFEAFTSTMRLP